MVLGKLYLPKIKIIGIGGGGGAIVEEIAKIFSREKIKHLNKIEFVAANVDWQALKNLSSKIKKFYFGEEITGGLGCGMDPVIGEKVGQASKEKIKKELEKTDFCIFISCLGGGTGSGTTPIFAEISNSLKILSIGFFTLPFQFEGRKKLEVAKNALEKIQPNLNATIVVHNQKLFSLINKNTSLWRSFFLMNKILAKTLQGLIETIYYPGLINTDFADLKNILRQRGGIGFLNSSWASGENRADLALKKLIENPLSNFNLKEAEAFLCDIAGPKNLKMQEVEKIGRTIFQFNPRAKIIFGVNNLNLADEIRITLLAVKYPQKKERKKIKSEVKKEKKKETKKEKESIKKEKKEEKKEVIMPQIKKRIRRNALDLQKMTKKLEEELLSEEKKWDIPTFLRKRFSS